MIRNMEQRRNPRSLSEKRLQRVRESLELMSRTESPCRARRRNPLHGPHLSIFMVPFQAHLSKAAVTQELLHLPYPGLASASNVSHRI